jgi:hypothetical protein
VFHALQIFNVSVYQAGDLVPSTGHEYRTMDSVYLSAGFHRSLTNDRLNSFLLIPAVSSYNDSAMRVAPPSHIAHSLTTARYLDALIDSSQPDAF